MYFNVVEIHIKIEFLYLCRSLLSIPFEAICQLFQSCYGLSSVEIFLQLNMHTHLFSNTIHILVWDDHWLSHTKICIVLVLINMNSIAKKEQGKDRRKRWKCVLTCYLIHNSVVTKHIVLMVQRIKQWYQIIIFFCLLFQILSMSVYKRSLNNQ